MKITILTLFPEFFESFLNTSIIKRALSKEIFEIELINIRDYTKDPHHRVDNYPTGGGAGLIMQCQPIVDALKSCRSEKSKVILTTPRGKLFKQEDAINLSREAHLIFLAGHYEGIDERVNDYVTDFYSLGDFIMTGGEIPTMAMCDAIIRLLDGAIAKESIEDESFTEGLLEYPQYTFPYNFEGKTIPDILFCGNHKAIAKWRKKQSLRLTKSLRPDLFSNYVLSKSDLTLLKELETDEIAKWEQEAINKGQKFLKKS